MKTYKHKLDRLKEWVRRRREEQEEHMYRSFAGTLTTAELHAVIEAVPDDPLLDEITKRFEAYQKAYKQAIDKGL